MNLWARAERGGPERGQDCSRSPCCFARRLARALGFGLCEPFVESLEQGVEALREAAEHRVGHGVEELACELDVVLLECLRRPLAVLGECDQRRAAVGWAAEDRVAVRLTLSGTHTAEYLGFPPTGRAVKYVSHEFYRVADGLIAEEWICSDTGSLFQQLSSAFAAAHRHPTRKRSAILKAAKAAGK